MQAVVVLGNIAGVVLSAVYGSELPAGMAKDGFIVTFVRKQT